MGLSPLSSSHPAHCTETRLYSEDIKKNRDAPRGCMQRGRGLGRGPVLLSHTGHCGWRSRCVCPSVCGPVCVSERDKTHRGVRGSVFIKMLKRRRGFMGLTAGGLEAGGFPFASWPPGQQGQEQARLRPSCREGWLKEGFSSSPQTSGILLSAPNKKTGMIPISTKAEIYKGWGGGREACPVVGGGKSGLVAGCVRGWGRGNG